MNSDPTAEKNEQTEKIAKELLEKIYRHVETSNTKTVKEDVEGFIIKALSDQKVRHEEQLDEWKAIAATHHSATKVLEGRLKKAEANLFVAKSMISMTEKAITDLRTRNERLDVAARKVVDWWKQINPPIADDFRSLTKDIHNLRDALSDRKGTV